VPSNPPLHSCTVFVYQVEQEKALDFKFPDPQKLSPPVLQCNDITFGYPGCEILYSHVDFGIDLDSRVALVGPNGAGKSTLLKIMVSDVVCGVYCSTRDVLKGLCCNALPCVSPGTICFGPQPRTWRAVQVFTWIAV
jgi:hypothetical protein